MSRSELSDALEPIEPRFCISFVYKTSKTRRVHREAIGTIARFMLLFLIRRKTHNMKQKTAQDSYNANAQSEKMKKHRKNISFPLFVYFVSI